MLSQVIWNVPHQEELAIYSVIANVFIWVIRIALMMFFNRLYYSKVVETIKKSRPELETKGEAAIGNFFRRKGGTSIVGPIILAIIASSASFVLAGFIVSSEFFIMPDLSQFL